MTRRILHLAAAAAAFAAAHPAFAQPAVELIPPPPPGVFDRPEGEVSPPEEPGADGPIAEAVGTGPSFTLRNVSLRGATAIPEAELAPIWAELIGTPVTLATLEDIASRIGARYRARGFVLSQALLPAQTIDQGDVEIVVVEGFVDRIEITGGAANQQALASRLFAPVAAERPAALPTLERAVLLSRDTFGPAVETVLEPSPDVFAAADLGVLITPDPFTGFAAVDNRGSRLYGTWTLSAGGSSYNLLGLNERLDGLIVAAPGDGSLAFGGAVFDAPLEPLIGTWLDGGRLEVSGNYSHADPDLAKSGYQQDL
ncbi:MAG: ShlB/FhaC/HecB family hemolysin secretion/activation protein, partial [Rhodobacteraceae bacterium]|nr:ShlB/FhaC/HecB family hemolysin secretion/activation protein [Paracoccaceae bacterium]